MTVRETLQFAQSCLVDQAPDATRVDRIIELLGLTECADTIVGNHQIRGISGGQKKRLSLAEVLVGSPRVLCLDEISSGLDSSTTLEIVTALKEWATQTGGTLIASLLQPTPETFALFDRVLCLMDGQMVYQGSRDGVLEYLAALGLECPADSDYADFVTDFLCVIED